MRRVGKGRQRLWHLAACSTGPSLEARTQAVGQGRTARKLDWCTRMWCAFGKSRGSSPCNISFLNVLPLLSLYPYSTCKSKVEVFFNVQQVHLQLGGVVSRVPGGDGQGSRPQPPMCMETCHCSCIAVLQLCCLH